MVTADDISVCDGYFSEIITVDGDTIYGVVCYTPDNYDYPVVIYEDSCCDMTILGLDDIATIYCGEFSSDGSLPNSCCATSPINNPILYATFQNVTGCNNCLDNVSVTVSYTGGLWRGSVLACNGCLITVKVYCLEESDDGFFWGASVYFDDTVCLAGMGGSNPITCSPFYMTFTNLNLDSSSCGCGCSGMVNLTITNTI